jgi:heat shock protein 4
MTPQQVTAAMLGKIKDLLRKNQFNNNDLILSVPSYFSDRERRAILDACKIAEITIPRLFNESSAIALGYGIFRKADLTDTQRNVVFIDMGHSKLSAFCAGFSKAKCTIIDETYDRNCGARDFDWEVARHLSESFEKKFGCSPIKSAKPCLRLLDAVDKVRKVLSANYEAGINLEYLMEEEDMNENITRDVFESLIGETLAKIRKCLEQLKEHLTAK